MLASSYNEIKRQRLFDILENNGLGFLKKQRENTKWRNYFFLLKGRPYVVNQQKQKN